MAEPTARLFYWRTTKTIIFIDWRAIFGSPFLFEQDHQQTVRGTSERGSLFFAVSFQQIEERVNMFANIKSACAVWDVRQKDVAKRIGVSKSLLSKIVRGKATASPELRRRLAAELHTTEDWLFRERIEIPKPNSPFAGW